MNKQKPISKYDFYSKLISWQNLLRKGYFDFQEFNNSYSYDDAYGKTDVIYPNYFNLKSIFENSKKHASVFDIIKTYDYFDGINNLDSVIGHKKKTKNYKFADTTPILFTIPKTEDTRRPLKFANLYSYCLLIDVIMSKKEEIIAALMSDKESTSRYFGYSPYDFNVSKAIEDKLLIGHSYYFKTDFSNFYHSFYTHAISWIFMGKEDAKVRRNDQDDYANLLDHAIRSQQDGETHGLPTGSLLTRIIVEYFMSRIDKELRTKFLDTSITFNRYVDDIVFGYDHPQELYVIKKVISEVAQNYGIYLNDKKVMSTTYNKIRKNSQLIGYFDTLSKNIKSCQLATNVKGTDTKTNHLLNILMQGAKFNVKNAYNSFYIKVNQEILDQVKGSGKLAFRVLMFFIQSVKNDKESKNITDNSIYKVLHALIEKNTKVSEKIQSSFIERMLQLTFSDTKLILPFIQLLDVIQEKENEINNGIVTAYLKRVIEQMGKENLASHESTLINKLYFDLKNNYHQEAYSIMLLFTKLNINLSEEMNVKIVTLITDSNDVTFDDFTLLFFLHNFVKSEKKIYLNDRFEFLNMIQKLLMTEDFGKECFVSAHWLLRYEVLFLYKTDSFFASCVDDYYKAEKCPNEDMSFEFFKAHYQLSNRGKLSNKEKKVNNFYFKLLDNNVNFTSF